MSLLIRIKEKEEKRSSTRANNVTSVGDSNIGTGILSSQAKLRNRNQNIVDKKAKTGTNTSLKIQLFAGFAAKNVFKAYRSFQREASNPYVTVEQSIAQELYIEGLRATGSTIGGIAGGIGGGLAVAGVLALTPIPGGRIAAAIVAVGSIIGSFIGSLFGGNNKAINAEAEKIAANNARLQFQFTQRNVAFARKLRGVRVVAG